MAEMKSFAGKQNIKGKKILITGGAGFLGTNLARALASAGNKIIICDNLIRRGSERNMETLRAEFKREIVVKIVDLANVPAIIHKERPDLIYHFAAQVAVTTSVESPLSDFRFNAEGTFLVARAAYSYGTPVIYSSTNKVYGDNVNAVPIKELQTRYDFDGALRRRGIDENFSIDSAHHTPYGCSKLTGELYVREFGGVVNRFSCMYGRYQNGIVDQGWLSFFVIQKLTGKPVTIFGDGKQVRDAVHADDVIRLLLLEGDRLLDAKRPSIRGEVFSIGGGYKNTISLLELCEKLDIKPNFGNWRPADQKVFYCDIRKAKRVLGWGPRIGIDQGLRDLISWTKKTLQR